MSIGLTPGDYKDKSLLRRPLSDKPTQKPVDARLAEAAPSLDGNAISTNDGAHHVPQAFASTALEMGPRFRR